MSGCYVRGELAMAELIMMICKGMGGYEITLGIILAVWPITYLIMGSD